MSRVGRATVLDRRRRASREPRDQAFWAASDCSAHFRGTVIGTQSIVVIALAYALHGDRLVADCEQRFLERDVQDVPLWCARDSFHWRQYIGGTAGRPELAANVDDEILLEGATYADRLTKSGPVPVILSAVTFGDLPDAKERQNYMSLPTSFALPSEDVDALREVAGRPLRACGGTSPAARTS